MFLQRCAEMVNICMQRSFEAGFYKSIRLMCQIRTCSTFGAYLWKTALHWFDARGRKDMSISTEFCELHSIVRSFPDNQYLKASTLPARLSEDHLVWMEFMPLEKLARLFLPVPSRRPEHAARGYKGCFKRNSSTEVLRRRKKRELETTSSPCLIHPKPTSSLRLLFKKKGFLSNKGWH